MNADTTQDIAKTLRDCVGKEQVMLLLNTGAQLPLEIIKVTRTVVTATASMQVQRVVMGTAVTQEIPWEYTIALETIIGVGQKTGDIETRDVAPNGIINPADIFKKG